MLTTYQKRFDQASKREIQKTAEAIVDLIGKRILSKITKNTPSKREYTKNIQHLKKDNGLLTNLD